MAKKLATTSTRQPGTRVFRVWIDSEFKRFTSVTASAIRNTIYLSDVEPHIKSAEYAYLNFKLAQSQPLLQEHLETIEPVQEIHGNTMNSDMSELEPVQDEQLLLNSTKAEAVDILQNSTESLPLIDPVTNSSQPLQADRSSKSWNSNPVSSEPAQDDKLLDIEQLMLMRRTPFHVKVDPHMIRAAGIIGKLNPELRYSEIALMRLYSIVRHIDTWRDGQNKGQKAWGYVTLAELRDWLKLAGLYTKQSLKRWIDDGVQAGYWHYDKAKKWVHYRSLKAVTRMLISALPDELLPDFMGNQAIGGRMVWIDVRGKLGAFKGQILGAWLEQRARDENGITAQSQTIADMWGVSVRTVQNWREAANIPHVPNFAETDNPQLPIKRIPNTYYAPEDTREHSHTGQSRKVRQLANSDMSERGFSPDSYLDVGEAKQHRLYFRDGENRTAFEAIDYYRNKYGSPHGLPQYALLKQHTVKMGVVGLHVEVLS